MCQFTNHGWLKSLVSDSHFSRAGTPLREITLLLEWYLNILCFYPIIYEVQTIGCVLTFSEESGELGAACIAWPSSPLIVSVGWTLFPMQHCCGGSCCLTFLSPHSICWLNAVSHAALLWGKVMLPGMTDGRSFMPGLLLRISAQVFWLRYHWYRSESLLCWESRVVKGSLFWAWRRSEYSFVCFTYCQELCLYGGHILWSLSFFIFCPSTFRT